MSERHGELVSAGAGGHDAAVEAGVSSAAKRVQLDAQIRGQIRDSLKADSVTAMEIVFLLTRMLPELCRYSEAIGQISAAYDLANIRKSEALRNLREIMS